MSTSWRAAALDLGSTRIKLGALTDAGTSALVDEAPFPMLEGHAERYAIDADALLRAATRLLKRVPAGVPLGIASQRSSFVLWERAGGTQVGDALSWRDRSAAPWCERHRSLAAEVGEESGLPFSPHYVGPKLAQRFEDDARLAERGRAGELCFGTLETFLAWHWSGRALHVTDPTMAARTLLFDPLTAAWSPRALQRFGVPLALLPTIVPTSGRAAELGGGRRLTASLADQASAFLATAREGEVLVNMGTGTFVMCAEPRAKRRPGYLCGPVFWSESQRVFAHEGTINGGAATLARFADVARFADTALLARADGDAEVFASPDESGLGAPRWRADATLRFSRDEAQLTRAAAKRAFLEGLAFRVREICDDIAPRDACVLVTGGVAREPYMAALLAAVLAPRRVELLAEAESTLLGALRLAAGFAPFAEVARTRIEPHPGNATALAGSYERWRAWMATQWP